MITSYTTYDRLRSVLGLTSKELPDLQLDSSTHLTVLFDERLLELSVNIAANYEAVKLLPSPSAQEARFVSLVDVYATYFFAWVLGDNLGALLQHEISDGRATVQRFDYIEIQQTGLLKQLRSLEGKLRILYLALYPAELFVTSSASDILLTRAVGLAVDPVTGA